jgi:hypothetical protein
MIAVDPADIPCGIARFKRGLSPPEQACSVSACKRAFTVSVNMKSKFINRAKEKFFIRRSRHYYSADGDDDHYVDAMMPVMIRAQKYNNK